MTPPLHAHAYAEPPFQRVPAPAPSFYPMGFLQHAGPGAEFAQFRSGMTPAPFDLGPELDYDAYVDVNALKLSGSPGPGADMDAARM